MRTCLDCQFLVKSALLGRGPQGETVFQNLQWDEEELKDREISRELGDKVVCFRGVWSQAHDPNVDVKARVEENRKIADSSCPWTDQGWSHRPKNYGKSKDKTGYTVG